MHAVTPAGLKYPGSHVSQVRFVRVVFASLGALARVVMFMYMPASHLLQNVPRWVDVSVSPQVWHSAWWARLEYQLAGHALQVVWAGLFWCSPGTQGKQNVLPSSGCRYPFGQAWHWLALVSPVSVEYFPTPQGLQSFCDLAPVALDHLPAKQPLHWSLEVLPVRLEYVPLGHCPSHWASEVRPV